MPATPRPRHQPTDEWEQLRLLVSSPEQATYELLRPIVLFGQPATTRSQETGVAARTLRRKVARFAAAGMRSLFEVDAPPAVDRRTLPLGIRKAIVELKAEYPSLKPFAIARICQHRFDRPVSYHTVAKVLKTEPLPLHPPRRLPRYRDIPDPVARRKVVVDLYLEGWGVSNIAGYLETTRRVDETLRRWVEEGLPVPSVVAVVALRFLLAAHLDTSCGPIDRHGVGIRSSEAFYRLRSSAFFNTCPWPGRPPPTDENL